MENQNGHWNPCAQRSDSSNALWTGLFRDLEAGGDAPALITEGSTLSWVDLARRADRTVADLAAQLPQGVDRPLVLLETANALEPVVTYLGLLRAGWPVIPVPVGRGGPEGEIARTFAPNILLRLRGDRLAATVTDAGQADMAPDLAVLLSTSGTTGAAKLVRLSQGNLASNAAAIADYLGATPGDRAATTLPFHYSYGMSVLHVQMLLRAPLVVTDMSVGSEGFWDLARETGVDTLALVPTQFDLIGANGPGRGCLPGLRRVTQAGGRMDQAALRRVAERARAEGWSFFAMYGQTEAGPRMSYVPPEEVLDWGHTIGKPIPGGAFRLIDAKGREITGTDTPGELVFTGPGVMQGYALTRADLATPSRDGPGDLATGDIAERVENGFFRIVGRASRFLKLVGMRIGLDEVEAGLRAEGLSLRASGTDATGLVLFATGISAADLDAKAAALARRFCLPPHLVRGRVVDAIPLLPSGKVDYRALTIWAEALIAPAPDTSDLRALLRTCLPGRDLDLRRSFLDHGGDSLAYLTVQMHLSDRFGEIPDGWETRPLKALLAQPTPAKNTLAEIALSAPAPQRLRMERVSGDLLARVAALLAVIALHATDWSTGGGAYLLLLLAGFSLVRFQGAALLRGEVRQASQTMLLQIATCYLILIAAMDLLWKPVPTSWFLFAGNLDPVGVYKGLYPYWFVSTYVQCILLLALPFLIPAVRAAVAARPLTAGLAALAATTLAMDVAGVTEIAVATRHHHPLAALQLALIGAVFAFATTPPARLAACAVFVALWALHWSDGPVSVAAILLAGGLATALRLSVPLPRVLTRSVMALGQVALFAYLAHPAVISLVSRLPVEFSDPLRFAFVLSLSLTLAGVGRRSYGPVTRRILAVVPRLPASRTPTQEPAE